MIKAMNFNCILTFSIFFNIFNLTHVPMPRKKSMRKKQTDQKGAPGIMARASG